MPAVAFDFFVRESHLPATRHRWNDANRVARLHRGLLFLQIPDVLVVEIDVDEAAELSLLVVEVRLQPRILRGEVGEQLADRRAVDFDGILLPSERSKRS